MQTPSILSTRAVIAAGESAGLLPRRARDGTMRMVRPGAYARASEWDAADRVSRQLTRIRLVQAAASSPLVFSHESAAALLGIPVLGRTDELVHVTAVPDNGRRSRHGIVWHESALLPEELADVGGLLVTSPGRTALDIAAARGMAAGVVALDAVLRSDVDPDRLRETLLASVLRRRPFRGVRRVDATLAVATGLADTPIESLSLARCAEYGIPAPQQQVRFVVPGRGTYFSDFFWPEWDMIGEADGRRKYEDDAARDGRDPKDVLWAEKTREDALRGMVRRFARWTWSDALDGARFAAIIRRAASR